MPRIRIRKDNDNGSSLSTISLHTRVQIGAVVVFLTFAGWIIFFVQSSVSNEAHIREQAIANLQEEHRTALISNKHELAVLARALTKHEDITGHSGVLTQIESLSRKLEIEKTEREGFDRQSIAEREELTRRINAEMSWNENQELRGMDTIERLSRLEERVGICRESTAKRVGSSGVSGK